LETKELKERYGENQHVSLGNDSSLNARFFSGGLLRSTTDDFKYKERFYNADNQCERRVQTNLIVGLEGEIERLRNLINIERQVHGASAEFLATKAHGLSDEVRFPR
jgi:hypothetical protein